MQIRTDYRGTEISLTEERVAKILRDHPEMASNMPKIGDTLAHPDAAVPSRYDPLVGLYYRLFEDTGSGSKYVCVVVLATARDAFVLTEYITGAIR